ncbi:uncharacterized protein VTP21DRAFT_5965 [Calcarisporiella thermophila]|uniref:uncharacterized protein n=1 Tax=Calcarisporiella thermophila TaxID=911321 RepID=UPI003741F09B
MNESKVEYQENPNDNARYAAAMNEKAAQDAANNHTKIDYDEEGVLDELVEIWQFSWRACFVGSFLGCIIAAANMYMGLRTGWGVGSGLFGAVLSFAILKPMSRMLPTYLGGGYFGPKENCTAQSAASAAGGLSAGFVSAIPAMYRLGLLQVENLNRDMVHITLWTIAAAFYGLFFAIPLRKHFVITQDLVFPTPRAAAVTIKSLHSSAAGEKEGMRSALILLISFVICFVWQLIGYWVPGLFGTPHILYWIGHATGSKELMEADTLWSWSFTWDFSFFGTGLMTPGSTSLSFLFGTVMTVGLAGPLMWRDGIIIDPMGFKSGPTAQTWFLWPGIALMVFTSFAELFVHYEVLWRGIKLFFKEFTNTVRSLTKRNRAIEKEQDPNDPALPHEQVPTLWWTSGLLASIIFTCAILGVFYGVQVYLTLLAIVLSFFLSFVGLQASGETDINPLGSIGKVSQLVFSPIPHPTAEASQMINLIAGNISSSAAAQSVDMVSDLKTGHLLGASPRSQFLAQIVGSVIAVAAALGLFYLYASAYPCILAKEGSALSEECKDKFTLVAVLTWSSVTKLLTTNSVTIPQASVNFTIFCCVFSVVYTVVKHKFVPEKYKQYMPNLNAIGIGFTQPSLEIPLAMVIGWTATKIWRRVHKDSWEKYMYSVAGGMIGVNGIYSLFMAIFTLANVKGQAVVVGCYPDGDVYAC